MHGQPTYPNRAFPIANQWLPDRHRTHLGRRAINGTGLTAGPAPSLAARPRAIAGNEAPKCGCHQAHAVPAGWLEDMVVFDQRADGPPNWLNSASC